MIRRGAIWAVAAVVLAVALPATANAQVTLTPNRFDDSVSPASGCTPDHCTLREAVEQVNGSASATIVLQAGTYELSQGQLVFQSADVVTIRGAGARSTTIDGNGVSRVFFLSEGSDVTIDDVTIAGGNANGQQQPPGEGGGIYLQGAGELHLNRSAVIGNMASEAGGGIFADDGAEIIDSTISGNTAGAIGAAGTGGGLHADSGTIRLANTTVSTNTAIAGSGGGIYNNSLLELANVTIAGNQASSGAGYLEAGSSQSQPRTFRNTIVASASGTACAGNIAIIGGDHNLDDDGSCGFSAVGDKPAVDPILGGLDNNGGATNTHALAATSPAVDAGDPSSCLATDQRGVARPQLAACDIGAFEYVQPPPQQQNPPLEQEQLPPPVAGKSVNLLPKRGTVRIKLRGSNRFVRLTEGRQVPVGTTVDTLRGRVTLVAAADKQGKTATSDFYDGVFKLGQTKGRRPITILTLTEKLSCPKAGSAIIAAKKKKRRLWGDGSGRFRTKGKHSAATVVGTKWLVEDRCKSTLTRVVRGRVSVRDFVKMKTVIVRAGKRYTARAG